MKIGFIGCGNMAIAMLKGILKSGEVKNADMIASAKSDKTREKIEKELGIQKADTNAQVVDFADVVFLAVKPQFLEEVLDEITIDLEITDAKSNLIDSFLYAADDRSQGVICGFKPLSDFLDAIVPPVASNKIRFFCCILSLRSIVIIPSVQQEAPPRFPLWLPSRCRCGRRYAHRPHAPDIQMQNRLLTFQAPHPEESQTAGSMASPHKILRPCPLAHHGSFPQALMHAPRSQNTFSPRIA